MNIIKNPFGAVNRDVKLYIGLLANDAEFTKLQLGGLDTFQQSLLCFAIACKDFSPVCPSLICHSMIKSSCEPAEVASCL